MSEKSEKISRMKLSALAKYLPDNTLLKLEHILDGYSVLIKVKSSRKTKFGDYRPLRGKKWMHQITINHDLNPYAFLITLVHEIAHMYTFAKHGMQAKPHGAEWKSCYSNLLRQYMHDSIFPDDLHACLVNHLEQPTASSCTDLALFQALKNYDEVEEEHHLVQLELLSIGEHFKWRNGCVFSKDEKLRTRYKCTDLQTRRTWYFHPLAEVEKVNPAAQS